MGSPLLQQSWNKYFPFPLSSVTPYFLITPFHVSVPVSTCSVKSAIRTVDSVGDTQRTASFTSSTKAWYSFVALGAYTCSTNNDQSSNLIFNIQTRYPKEIQSDTQPDHRFFSRRLETQSLVFFLHCLFVLEYADSYNLRDCFFIVYSFFEYVLSYQSNTRDRKTLCSKSNFFFFNALLFFSARLYLIY